MNKKRIETTIFLFFFYSYSISGFSNAWMVSQIQEDCSLVTTKHITGALLHSFFLELCEQNYQGLYCTIHNNHVSWEATPRIDQLRNFYIIKYFDILSKKRPLPDTEFILLTDDGCASPQRFPVFTFSRFQKVANVLLFPDFEIFKELTEPHCNFISICSQFSRITSWNSKKSQAFFRGVSTGGCNPSLSDFGNDRVRVILFSAEYPDLIDATFNQIFQEPFRDLLDTLGKNLETISVRDQFYYKYLLDIDGNASGYSRPRWILLSNSVPIKIMSDWTQWYFKALTPWIHFVPIKNDLSNLYHNLTFLQQNDERARLIAYRGQNIGKTIFSNTAIENYLIKLLNAYTIQVFH